MPSGEMRWQRWSDRAIFDPDGKIIEYQSVGRDISDIIKAEEALRESEERYRAFFATSIDCVFITSVDGVWLDFNDLAVLVFGYADRDELQKVNVRNLYQSSIDRKNHLAFIKEKGYSKQYPVNLKKKDGTIINSLITTVPIKDNTGTVIGFQGTIQDITERRKTGDALEKANKRLNLLTTITRHDILNKVATILGYIELFREKPDTAEIPGLMERLEFVTKTIRNEIEFTESYQKPGAWEPRWLRHEGDYPAVSCFPSNHLSCRYSADNRDLC